MKFRKKPVEIEAAAVTSVIAAAGGGLDEILAVPDWVNRALTDRTIIVAGDGLEIRTLEGTMTASPDDWVIQGVKGELYPCKPEIFAATYTDSADQEQGVPFNGLTPGEAERLAILAEELAEAGQVIGKILRHGYESRHPFNPTGPTNRKCLELELGDVKAAIHIAMHAGDLSVATIDERHQRKLERIGRWLHHQVTLPAILPRTGIYFAADGTMMNADGTRSIFDDVDK